MEFSVRPSGFTCIEHGQSLEVIVHFSTGWDGMIYLTPERISFEACGVLTYTVGEPHDTTVTCENGEFCYTHNGYGYTMPAEGCRIEAIENGYRLIPTAAIKLHMAKR